MLEDGFRVCALEFSDLSEVVVQLYSFVNVGWGGGAEINEEYLQAFSCACTVMPLCKSNATQASTGFLD